MYRPREQVRRLLRGIMERRFGDQRSPTHGRAPGRLSPEWQQAVDTERRLADEAQQRLNSRDRAAYNRTLEEDYHHMPDIEEPSPFPGESKFTISYDWASYQALIGVANENPLSSAAKFVAYVEAGTVFFADTYPVLSINDLQDFLRVCEHASIELSRLLEHYSKPGNHPPVIR